MGPGPLNSERMRVHNLQTQRSPLNYHVHWLGLKTGGAGLLSTHSIKQCHFVEKKSEFCDSKQMEK